MNTFAISKTAIFCTLRRLTHPAADSLDTQIRKLVKKHLRLPVRTNCAFLHLSTRRGGLGLRSISQAWDRATITRATKSLSSSDRTVSDVAWAKLRATIQKRMGTPPTSAEEMFHFLNTPPRRNEGSKEDVRSLWAVVRRPLSRHGVSLAQDEEGRLLLRIDCITRRRPFLTPGERLVMSEPWKLYFLIRIRVVLFPLISQHHSSNNWIFSGKYVSFADYRFAIRERPNLLPVAVVKKRIKKTTITSCPLYKAHPETLGHLLNSCTPLVGLMRARHNLILRRLVNAIPRENNDIFVEQRFLPANLKPDIVVLNRSSRDATVVDVTCPYEGECDSFKKARAEKEQKYAGLKEWMKDNNYNSVTVHAFIFGSLGAWDLENLKTLKALHISVKYSQVILDSVLRGRTEGFPCYLG